LQQTILAVFYFFSAGVRAFIENDYVGLKQANPQFPILIRECSGIVPRVFARSLIRPSLTDERSGMDTS
uniref:NADH dehydrogenase [ubiquinone] 1 alpha subcomplex subunit 2 n=1 Tax=Heligmosomoides polygyrus TaxID=6339 RepID=A0A183G5Y0_HELPZ